VVHHLRRMMVCVNWNGLLVPLVVAAAELKGRARLRREAVAGC